MTNYKKTYCTMNFHLDSRWEDSDKLFRCSWMNLTTLVYVSCSLNCWLSFKRRRWNLFTYHYYTRTLNTTWRLRKRYSTSPCSSCRHSHMVMCGIIWYFISIQFTPPRRILNFASVQEIFTPKSGFFGFLRGCPPPMFGVEFLKNVSEI